MAMPQKVANKTKSKTTKAKTKKENSWKELVGDNPIKEFINIVDILNRFYSLSYRMIGKKNEFREKVAKSKPSDLKIYLKKFSDYEFLVVVHIISEGLTDNWIHIDGVTQEKENYKKTYGTENHKVFSIVSLTDLYDKYTIEVSTDDIESITKEN